MDISTTGLIVVDMQNGFVSSKSAHIVPAVRDIVAAWQAMGGQTLFTRFINPEGSSFERLIHWTRLRESPEIDIVDQLAPFLDNGDVIEKPIYSALTPNGRSVIESHGWTDLIIVGIATESCVLKTATDAFEAGYTPWVVDGAVYSHAGEEPHNAGMLVIKRFIGRNQIVGWAHLLEMLNLPSSTPTAV